MNAKQLSRQLMSTEMYLAGKEELLQKSIHALREVYGIPELTATRDMFKKELFDAFIDEKLYLPMSKLRKYKGKVITSINLILEDKTIHTLSKSHGMSVDNKGHLYCLRDDDYDRAFYHDGEMYGGYNIKETRNNRYIGFYNVYVLDKNKFKKQHDREFNPEFDCADFDESEVDTLSEYHYLIGV